MLKSFPYLVLLLLSPVGLSSQNVTFDYLKTTQFDTYYLGNELVKVAIVFQDGQLTADSLIGSHNLFASKVNVTPAPAVNPFTLTSDAGFALDIVWTDWQAPGMKNNGDNPLRFTEAQFRLVSQTVSESVPGTKECAFTLKASGLPVQVILRYQLSSGKFFCKRRLEVCDSTDGIHFLETLHSRKGSFSLLSGNGTAKDEPLKIINTGGFGQPLAFTNQKTGAFLAIEYPAAHNTGSLRDNHFDVDLFQEIGKKISGDPVCGEWAVGALIPGPHVQSWFYDYLDDVRVAPAVPYTLYNSWYDLRSPEYPGVQPVNVMNESNVFRIIDLFKKNMIDKHHIQMDAFVLDDGWDNYQSDWVLRKETFPRGLKPVSDKLKESGTGLGIWFGPTGGYSFRMKRIDWMKQQGYEVVGNGRDHAMLCLGGKKYSALFEKRVTDMVSKEGISYFKWDGIQFSCSENGHGHPEGIYSRGAILESLISKCQAVRKLNPSVYLNITSGTWLSPWWLKYANQIWMDGGDFGFADVPSVHKRDAAITYRDFVLYDDFKTKGLWFPTSNLMTHGIIKGKLENVGGQNDPIDKFTNDVVLYFARGISMYELYISPDLLREEEWDVIGKSIQWAKSQQEVLSKTFMVGGNPTKGETYGYVHFKGSKGIIAARNPVIEPSRIFLRLDPSYGLDEYSGALVLEKVYPYHYIYPEIYFPGNEAEIPLEGFETAIYEVYPLDPSYPLPAGIRFDLLYQGNNTFQLDIFRPSPHAGFLGDAKPHSMTLNGTPLKKLSDLPMPRMAAPARLVNAPRGAVADLLQPITVSHSEKVAGAMISYLIHPAPEFLEKEIPAFTALVDGKEADTKIESEKGKWVWISVPVTSGEHSIALTIKDKSKTDSWKGSTTVWSLMQVEESPVRITMDFTVSPGLKEKIHPPLPFSPNITSQNMKLIEGEIFIPSKKK